MKFFKNKNGFSLIEILIAVGILAAAIATLMSQVEVSARLSVDDEKLFQAVTLANNKMVELEVEIQEDMARGKFPDRIKRDGEFEKPFEDYSWEYTVDKVIIPVMGGQEGQNIMMASAIKSVVQQISKSVRVIKLTVRWGKEEDENLEEGEESPNQVTLATHIVNLQ